MTNETNLLAEVDDLFGSRSETFDLTLPTGKSISFRTFRKHRDWATFKREREEFASQLASKSAGNPSQSGFPPSWHDTFPVEKETALAVYSLARTCTSGLSDLDWLRFADTQPLVFDSLYEHWSLLQLASGMSAFTKEVDDAGNASAPTTSSAQD